MNDLTQFLSSVSRQVPHLLQQADDAGSHIRFGQDDRLPQAQFVQLPAGRENEKFGYLCKFRPHDPKEFLMRFPLASVQGILLTGIGYLITGDSVKKVSSKARLNNRANFEVDAVHWTFTPEVETYMALVSDQRLFKDDFPLLRHSLSAEDSEDLIANFNLLLNPPSKLTHFAHPSRRD